jgi:hypothetical protein
MTNSVKMIQKIDYIRGGVTVRPGATQQTTIETTSELMIENTQIVGTTHELITAGDLTDDVFAVIENLDDTETVQVGGDASTVFVEWFTIPPGHPKAILPNVGALASTYLKATGANTPVRVSLYKIVAPV